MARIALPLLVYFVIMWGLIRLGMGYIPAAIIASEVTIIGNFLLLEYLVFRDMRADSGSMWMRFIKSFAFNNVEAVVRISVLPLLVQAHIPSVLTAAGTVPRSRRSMRRTRSMGSSASSC